jgi:hypothetical protein
VSEATYCLLPLSMHAQVVLKSRMCWISIHSTKPAQISWGRTQLWVACRSRFSVDPESAAFLHYVHRCSRPVFHMLLHMVVHSLAEYLDG